MKTSAQINGKIRELEGIKNKDGEDIPYRDGWIKALKWVLEDSV